LGEEGSFGAAVDGALPIIQSAIPSLEPVLGAALAINLAYLYIPWFHYLKIIGETARKALRDTTDSSTILQENSDKNGVSCVKYLASLGESKTEKIRCSLWGQPWSYPLRFFTWKIDKFISFCAVAFVISLIVVGSAHGMGIYTDFLFDIDDNTKHKLLHWSTLCIGWPFFMAFLAYIVRLLVEGFVYKTIGKLASKENKDEQSSFSTKPDL